MDGDEPRSLLRETLSRLPLYNLLCPCNHLLTSQDRDQAGDGLCVTYEQLTPSCLSPPPM